MKICNYHYAISSPIIIFFAVIGYIHLSLMSRFLSTDTDAAKQQKRQQQQTLRHHNNIVQAPFDMEQAGRYNAGIIDSYNTIQYEQHRVKSIYTDDITIPSSERRRHRLKDAATPTARRINGHIDSYNAGIAMLPRGKQHWLDV